MPRGKVRCQVALIEKLRTTVGEKQMKHFYNWKIHLKTLISFLLIIIWRKRRCLVKKSGTKQPPSWALKGFTNIFGITTMSGGYMGKLCLQKNEQRVYSLNLIIIYYHLVAYILKLKIWHPLKKERIYPCPIFDWEYPNRTPWNHITRMIKRELAGNVV